MYLIVFKNLTIYLYIYIIWLDSVFLYPAIKQKPIVSSLKNRLFLCLNRFFHSTRWMPSKVKQTSTRFVDCIPHSPSHICIRFTHYSENTRSSIIATLRRDILGMNNTKCLWTNLHYITCLGCFHASCHGNRLYRVGQFTSNDRDKELFETKKRFS